jgi:NitT/TauT family transport system substrate-binding protein
MQQMKSNSIRGSRYKKHFPLVLAGLLAATSLLSLVFPSCSIGTKKLETVILGTNPIELNALIYIAEERGFFADNGIQIHYRDYVTGVAAVDGLLKGENDLAMATEFVIVGNIFNKRDVVALASVDESILFYLVAPSPSGIRGIKDLKGKRIGVPGQTIMEFYLGRILEINGIGLETVTLVNTSAADPGGALSAGNIDAVVTWGSYLTDIEKRFNSQMIILGMQSDQPSFWSAVSTSSWVKQNPALIKRFLTALARAESEVNRHPAEAKESIRQRLNYTSSYIETIWPQNQFSLSLDQSLIAAMEGEARWMIKNQMTTEKEVPNFVQYIYVDGLEAAKPEAVNLIH